MEKKAEEKLSPTSKMLKKRKEKAARDADKRKKQAAAKRKAEQEAKEAESKARVAEMLPGGKMRPLDYAAARGTGQAPLYSAKKAIPQDIEDYSSVDTARKALFGKTSGVPCRSGAPRTGGIPRGPPGRKTLGRKGPSAPGGPEFQAELRQHQIKFPGRQMGVVVGGGKFKRMAKRSEDGINRMEEIDESEPCDPCEVEDEDDYAAALQELGITAEQAAATFDIGFIDELDEEEAAFQDPAGSPNAIQQLEAQMREMDEYEREQAQFWRDMAGDLTEEELRELGVTRAQLEKEYESSGVGARKPCTRLPEKRQLTQQQVEMLAQLQEIEQRTEELAGEPQKSPILNEFDLIEQAVIQREQEEREYYERMMRGEQDSQGQSAVRSPARSQRSTDEEERQMGYEDIEQAVIQREQEEREYFERMIETRQEPHSQSHVRSPCRSPARSPARSPTRSMTEEQERMEFEELERQMAMEAQNQEIPAYAQSPRAAVNMNEAAMQQESMVQKRLFEQQLQTQGLPRQRAFPASGITYSPPRPQGVFGPPPYEHRGIPSPPRRVSPPRQPTPCQTPAHSTSPRIPTPPSPPPMPPSPSGLLEETPPYIEDMEEDDRLRNSPCRPRTPPVPRWSPTPSPPRAPCPPPFIPTPPSPLLYPPEIREQVTSRAIPDFNPVSRRDVLRRDDRRTFKAPGVDMYNVQEEEPLIPELAGDESFMGWPVIPGEKAPRRKKRQHRDLKPKRLFGQSTASNVCRSRRSHSPGEYSILDDPIPEGVPGPKIIPRWQAASPIQMTPLVPVPLAPWEGVGYRHPTNLPSPPRYRLPEMPVHTEIYQGGGTVHPDLEDLVGYEPPLNIPEDMEGVGDEGMDEGMYFSPERYHEIEERELDREANLAYEPPPVLKNIWLSSPQELGAFTPPSVGRGRCGTYTPTATPPLQLLESPLIENQNDDFMAEGVNVPDSGLEEFFVRTPPLERVTSIQEMLYYSLRAPGRKGIKPKPMYFGGYGETPQRPIPRWYGRGGARNVIREVEEPYSPPMPGTPPPQLPAPLSVYSPELDEFQQLELQMEKEESSKRKSKRRQRREEIERQFMLTDLMEQAERKEMEARMAAQTRSSRNRSPICQRALSPPPRIPTPPPLPQMRYSPEMRGQGAALSPCGPPPIDNQALEEFLLQEMGFDSSDMPQITPPGTPDLMDQQMYDVLEEFESPPPLSPEADRPCMSYYTPPAPPSPPPPPMSPQRPEWEIYVEQMQQAERERQAKEQRRQQIYQDNLQDIRQTFGPSPGPPSPGPDADFYAQIYSHQIPCSFRQGDRPRTAIRDQIGRREISMQLPRHTPGSTISSSAITEQRVRIDLPEQAIRRPVARPRPAPPCAATPQPLPQMEQKSSAQRIAEARKHYQQVGRQMKIGRTRLQQRNARQGTRAAPQQQLNLQSVEDFVRQPDQQQAAQTAPCAAARPRIDPEEAQRRAKERLRAKQRQEQGGIPTRASRAAAPPPPPPQPFTDFLPPQVGYRKTLNRKIVTKQNK